LIVLSVIVYVLRQNCRAAGWRWDRKRIGKIQPIELAALKSEKFYKNIVR
jgi:hypothetical protein